MAEPEIVRYGMLDMQVCVPKEWTDKEVLKFAEQENLCGTTAGWEIRKRGNKYLGGCDERTQCCDHEENVHIMLDA